VAPPEQVHRAPPSRVEDRGRQIQYVCYKRLPFSGSDIPVS
jgi:hypothetical protein